MSFEDALVLSAIAGIKQAPIAHIQYSIGSLDSEFVFVVVSMPRRSRYTPQNMVKAVFAMLLWYPLCCIFSMLRVQRAIPVNAIIALSVTASGVLLTVVRALNAATIGKPAMQSITKWLVGLDMVSIIVAACLSYC